MTRSRRNVLATLGAAGTGAVAGTSSVSAIQPDDGTARVRVGHLSPDAPNVDILVDGTRALSDVPFGTVSEYLSVPAGERTVAVTAAGDPDAVVFQGDVGVTAGGTFTIAAIGELSEETFQPLILTDEVKGGHHPPAVRVVHASPDAPAVDVTVFDGLLPVFKDLSFGNASRTQTVLPFRSTFEVRAAADGKQVTELTTKPKLGTTYTVFATGYLTPDDEPSDASFTLIPATTRAADGE
jgi:hypothetical protein